MARITVLMGIYNCASTLVEALDSLYAQTYQDFKIVLCEDGSTDDTYNVARAYAENHENIILVRNEKNMGLNYTLNRCLQYADTEYCARMDGDDISLPNRFEKEIDFLDANPEFAVVSCPMIHFDENGEIFRGKVVEGKADKSIFNYGSPFCHAPSMIRTKVLKEVCGYTMHKRLLRVEDYDLWRKIYESGYSGYNLSEHLYMMRDDRNATQRRTLRARCNGIYAHWLAYRGLNLSIILFLRYSIIGLLLGIMPVNIYEWLRRLINK